MHYDFKQKLNAIDSHKYRDLAVPEIDWKLNEAQELFVKIVAEPRLQSQLGFEVNQRTIDDIRGVVINQTYANGIVPDVFDTEDKSYIALLPSEYMHYIGSKCYADKGTCVKVKLKVQEVQHDDDSEASIFDKSSFEWRRINVRFIRQGIRMFTDGTFIPKRLCIEYIKMLGLIHNADDWIGGTYELLDGTVLTGTVDCELAPSVHREVVDLAVFITSGDLNLSSYNIKQNKIKLNNT